MEEIEGHTRDIKTSYKATVFIQGRHKSGNVDRERYIKAMKMTLYPGIQRSRKTSLKYSILPRTTHCVPLERWTENGEL